MLAHTSLSPLESIRLRIYYSPVSPALHGFQAVWHCSQDLSWNGDDVGSGKVE
jgi:hypothetical protein